MALTLLMNAKAGKLHRTPSVEEMRATLRALKLEVNVRGTESKEEFRGVVRELVQARAERIAVAGGDGTVRLAAVEIAGSDTALSIVPQGTMNNFATALRLPLDLPSALRVSCTGEVREIDLGRVCFPAAEGDGSRSRLFTESAGVGLFANALALYGGHNKSLWHGVRAVARTLLDFRPSRIMLTRDGERHEEPMAWVVAANGFRMAQALPVAPGASVTDGELDVLVLGDLKRNELLPYYLAIRRQTHLALPKTQLFRARHLRLEARRPMPVHIDDRIGGNTPVEIDVLPHALRVVIERL